VYALILPDSAPARKTLDPHIPDFSLSPIHAELICPGCYQVYLQVLAAQDAPVAPVAGFVAA